MFRILVRGAHNLAHGAQRGPIGSPVGTCQDALDPAFARADLLVGEGMAGFVADEVQQWVLRPGGAGTR